MSTHFLLIEQDVSPFSFLNAIERLNVRIQCAGVLYRLWKVPQFESYQFYTRIFHEKQNHMISKYGQWNILGARY